MFAASKCYKHWACVRLTCMHRFVVENLHRTLHICETLRGNLYLVLMEGLCTFHMFCLYIHTLTLTAGDKQTSGGQSCSLHSPRLIRVSCHKGRNAVWSHITHINTPELKWVVCVSGYMTQSLFLIESCPFIIQSWET